MCAPDSPDTSRADANAAKITQLSEEQFNWVKQKYDESAPERAKASKTAQEVSDAQLAAMKTATAQSEDYAAYNKGVFRPLEAKIVRDAQGYDTEATREAAAGRAAADVEQAAGSAQADSLRDMTRMGINPADGAYAEMAGQREVALALGKAGAENRARTQVQTVGAAKMADAANMGRNIPSQQATQASLAMTTGNSAVTNANVPNQITAGGVGMVSGGARDAVGGYGAGANIYNQGASIQAQSQQGGSGLASLAGSAMTAYAI